jgi:hypothetical protein
MPTARRRSSTPGSRRSNPREARSGQRAAAERRGAAPNALSSTSSKPIGERHPAPTLLDGTGVTPLRLPGRTMDIPKRSRRCRHAAESRDDRGRAVVRRGRHSRAAAAGHDPVCGMAVDPATAHRAEHAGPISSAVPTAQKVHAEPARYSTFASPKTRPRPERCLDLPDASADHTRQAGSYLICGMALESRRRRPAGSQPSCVT